MKSDTKKFVQTCVSCQRAKIHRDNVAPLQRFSLPDIKFSEIHIDLVGPLCESNECNHLLTVICRYSHHVEAIPLRDTTAKSCADAFILNWVSRFGSPKIIVTDRGPQFTSNLWVELCQFLGAKL